MSSMKKQIKINYENMMKIDDKYQDLVSDIVCYIRAELISYDAEEAINDINEILLGAQYRNEDLFELVGDYKEFCNEVISSYKDGVKNYKLKLIIEYIPIFIYAVIFFFALDLVTSVIYSRPTSLSEAMSFEYTITLAPIITCTISLIVAISVFTFIAKDWGKEVNNKKANIIFMISYILIVLVLVGAGFLGKKVEIITLKNVSIPIIIGFMIVIVAVVSMFKFVIQGRMEIKKRKNKAI